MFASLGSGAAVCNAEKANDQTMAWSLLQATAAVNGNKAIAARARRDQRLPPEQLVAPVRLPRRRQRDDDSAVRPGEQLIAATALNFNI